MRLPFGDQSKLHEATLHFVRRLDYHLSTLTMAARARSEATYKGVKFSDHAPITVEYDFKL